MKNYEKPNAVMTPELSEGVFAASGAAEDGLKANFWVNGEDGYGTQIAGDATFASGDSGLITYLLTVNFNQAVTIISKNAGYLCSCQPEFLTDSGTKVVIRFKRLGTAPVSFHCNNWFYVQGIDGLSVTSSSLEVV